MLRLVLDARLVGLHRRLEESTWTRVTSVKRGSTAVLALPRVASVHLVELMRTLMPRPSALTATVARMPDVVRQTVASAFQVRWTATRTRPHRALRAWQVSIGSPALPPTSARVFSVLLVVPMRTWTAQRVVSIAARVTMRQKVLRSARRA